MKLTLVLCLALGVVSADVGLGYQYPVPHTSYGYPSYQHGGASQYQTASSTSGFYQASGSTSGSNYVQPSYTESQTQYSGSSQYQEALKRYQNYYQVQQQPTQVFKHFYIHAAPEEREEVRPRAPIVLPAPQKHYKIIFVKAPSESSPPSLIAPIQPQNEEKTIVYVLVKKPDEPADIVLPKIEQKPPSKPEVYFIKYKNKEDSQAVINNIVKDYNQGQSESLSSSSSGGSSSFQSGGSSSFQSGGGNVHYQSPIQHGSLSLSTASANSGVHYTTPIVSSTASSINYEGAISTSQGVPHESYGIPNFRNN